MIPVPIMMKIGTSKIEVMGTQMQVTLIDNVSLADACIQEFRTLVQTSKNLVGFDTRYSVSSACIVCVKNRCLIFQLDRMGVSIPVSLKEFLGDESICFLGKRFINFKALRVRCGTGVSIGELAHRVLRKPEMEKLDLRELASAVGVAMDQPPSVPVKEPNWSDKVFSEEKLKGAITEAYTCFAIGNKLLSTVT